MTITYRLAKTDDVPAMSRLIAQTWRQAYRKIFSDQALDTIGDSDWEQGFYQGLEIGRDFIVADKEGKIVGSVIYGPGRLPDYRDLGEIYSLYVHPDQQGQGIGRQLLERAIAALNHEEIYLLVAAQQEDSRAFYERIGFTRTGILLDDQFKDEPFQEAVYLYKKEEAE